MRNYLRFYHHSTSANKLTMVQALNSAMDIILEKDESSINHNCAQSIILIKYLVLFGEDVAFGGVFRCSMGLREKFGSEILFNCCYN